MSQVVKIAGGRLPFVSTVTINRPDKRNALNRETVDSLRSCFESLSTDDTTRVVILTGAGSVFSAGADLEALKALQTASDQENLEDSAALASLLETMVTFPKPIIARVNGHAIAGGGGLMAACDYAIAVDSARFGFTEVRIGFVPAIVMHFVAQRLSGRDLRDLFLSGRLIDGAEAQRIGLINEAVSTEELDMVVDRIAIELATQTSPQAIARTKLLLAKIPFLPLRKALDVAERANADARGTSDCKEGVAAFLEKREPAWKQGS